MRKCLLFLLMLLAGCASLGYDKDPFTGGVDSTRSSLLGISFPSGWQFYPSHSNNDTGRAGLETWRSSADPQQSASSFFNTLSQGGWQLRLFLQKNDRILCLYQKDSEYAVLNFRKQGMLTILEVWKGQSMPDGSLPSNPSYDFETVIPEIVGEEYAPGDQPITSPAEVPDRGQIEEKILW